MVLSVVILPTVVVVVPAAVVVVSTTVLSVVLGIESTATGSKDSGYAKNSLAATIVVLSLVIKNESVGVTDVVGALKELSTVVVVNAFVSTGLTESTIVGSIEKSSAVAVFPISTLIGVIGVVVLGRITYGVVVLGVEISIVGWLMLGVSIVGTVMIGVLILGVLILGVLMLGVSIVGRERFGAVKDGVLRLGPLIVGAVRLGPEIKGNPPRKMPSPQRIPKKRANRPSKPKSIQQQGEQHVFLSMGSSSSASVL